MFAVLHAKVLVAIIFEKFIGRDLQGQPTLGRIRAFFHKVFRQVISSGDSPVFVKWFENRITAHPRSPTPKRPPLSSGEHFAFFGRFL